MEPIEYWQIDKIESLLQLCPYNNDYRDKIMDNLPETKEEANLLLDKLWFDHIPRDPKDQFDKMIKMKTLIKIDFKYEYVCDDCGENWISRTKDTLCTSCLSPNIKQITDE
jgi:formylmethanofuran dehydrogenase subunit E